MKIIDMVKESRPREKFEKYGKETLSEAELLAIILRTGTKNENVVDMANKLINKFPIEELFYCSTKELQKINGIGPAKAMQILSIAEIAKRHSQSKKKRDKIKSAKDVFDIFQDKFLGVTTETFSVILLDTKNKIIKTETISVGTLDASIVHPREVFKAAVRNSASRIIAVHNHPSGDPAPSEDDLRVTKNLIEVGELMGIEVLDHVIIGDEAFWSWAEDR